MASPTHWRFEFTQTLGAVKDPESWPAALHSVTNCQIQLNNEQNVCPNATRLSTLLVVVTNETKQTVKRVSVPSTPALKVISWR